MFTINPIAQSLLIGFGWPGLPEMMIIGALFLLIFGGAKLPGLMRNLGRSVNEFKAGIKDPVDSSNISDASDDEPERERQVRQDEESKQGEEINS